jgi:hypothetical protein
MDPVLQPVSDKLDNQSAAITTLQLQTQSLESQVANLTSQLNNVGTVVISNIQAGKPETLWYEARSASAPKTGPHGTVNITPGNICTADFHPISLPNNQSDNCYNLYRLYPTLTPIQKAILEAATKLSVGYVIDSIYPSVSSMQAVELDYQIRKSSGVVINIGLQLLPDGTLRVFDFVNKAWEAVGPKVTFGTSRISLRLNATCDNQNVKFTSVTVNDVDQPISLSHPTSKDTTLNPYFNTAFQLDGRADAKPYVLTFEKLTSTFSI